MTGTIAFRFDVVAIGAMTGLGYAVLATGLVLVYRATKVINLAHGQIGAFCAVLLAVLVRDEGLPYYAAFACAIAAGAVVGWVLERGLVRPLVARSQLAVLVATIGVSDLLLVGQSKLPGVIGGQYPTPFNWSASVGSLLLHGEHFTLLIFGPITLALFTYFISRTRFGLAIRGLADNREAAQLTGMKTERVSSLVWVVAGILAAIAAILTLPLSTAGTATVALGPILGPSLLLRALAAGLAGRMTNLPITIGAGIAIGVVEAVLYASFPTSLGMVDLVLLIFIVVMLLARGRGAAESEESVAFGGSFSTLPERIRTHPTIRRIRNAWTIVVVAAALVLPVLFTTSTSLFLLTQVPIYAIVGVSIVMLTGWAGQLSLCQMAFVGIGAMGTAALTSRGVPFGAALGYSVVAGVFIAVVVGAPALRLRGLFLTVTTLGFAVATSSYLLNLSWFQSSNLGVAEVTPGKLWFINFNSYRVDYYLCVICLGVAVLIARRVRSTGIGRTLIAVEGNETSLAAMSISPAVVKLQAFAIAGGMATFAGGLLAAASRTFQSDLFSPAQSLQMLSMAVIGGVGSLGGAVLGAIYLVGLPDLFNNSLTVQLATSGIGLLIILRVQPAGFIGVWQWVRDRAVKRLVPELVDEPVETTESQRNLLALNVQTTRGQTEESSIAEPVGSQGHPEVPALSIRDLSVERGGRVVVSNVNLVVQQYEIVGLIGSNGAGKSTLMNAVCGFLPSTGEVEINGSRVDHLPPFQRARLGLGRSFQGAMLYPRLTVRECVQVALESRHRSEVLPSLLALPPAIAMERWNRRAADELLGLLGLGDRAEQASGTVSTGTRRVVEFACLLAQQPTLVLLDEPMAGIAQRESEAFASLLVTVRRELNASMLVIEHDMPLVTEISDRLYCLESGQVIAQGGADSVRNDPKVIASYLGTDERAISRSGPLAGNGALASAGKE